MGRVRYPEGMQIVVNVPDALATRLGGTPATLSHAAFVALAIDAYRCGQLTEFELGDVLQLPTRDDVDGLLKRHGVFLDYTWDELEAERATLDRVRHTESDAGT